MIEEMLFAGFGGQGVLLAGQLLTQAAMNDGFHASWFPSYGPEMRGGTANCTVVYADDEIGSPIASQYDTVLVLNQPSLDRFQAYVKPGGQLIVNVSLIEISERREDITFVEVPANELAIKLGSDRSANVVMLGAYSKIKNIIAGETIKSVVEKTFARKGDKVVEMNRSALVAGFEAATSV
ncbi:2-oxoacid:acceptor oxidoreductase family protein [Oligoflexia bacterium]|nr:2-oxoacid:acceptor oxidoreductase family protein [Oligoflexia bacterium]